MLNTEWPSLCCTVLTAFQKIVFVVIIVYLKRNYFEEYLTYLRSILRQRVLKFRLSNHRLPIQQRRSLGIPRDERICIVCDSGEVGDEFHYLL